MVNGLKVPSRQYVMNPSGTLERSESGYVVAVERCRSGNTPRPDRKCAGQPKRNSRGVDRREKLMAERIDVRTGNRHRWVRRAASGERVKRGQGTRHNDPVTSEEGMPKQV